MIAQDEFIKLPVGRRVLLRAGDWRTLVFLLIVSYFLAVSVSAFYMSYDRFWGKYLGVYTMKPLFADLHNITSAWDCHRLGYDVVLENPCDPDHRAMSYPRVWLVFTIFGLQQSHTIYIAVLIIICYFASTFWVIGPLNRNQAILYGTIFISPSMMLAVERGTSDLIVFTLLAFSLLLLQRSARFRNFAYPAIFLASILKLFPCAAVAVALRENIKRMVAIFFVFCFVFILYLIVSYQDLIAMQKLMVRSTYLSFGSFVAFRIIGEWLAQHGLAVSNWVLRLVQMLLCVFIFGCVFLNPLRVWRTEDTRWLDSFRIGASVYAFSFLFWENWDYRLIFLIFTIPQILAWIKMKESQSNVSAIALFAIVLTVWISARWPYNLNFAQSVNLFFVDELLNWFLFGYFLFGMARALPASLKKSLYPSRYVAEPEVVIFEKVG